MLCCGFQNQIKHLKVVNIYNRQYMWKLLTTLFTVRNKIRNNFILSTYSPIYSLNICLSWIQKVDHSYIKNLSHDELVIRVSLMYQEN